MTEHTPGPWKVHARDEGYDIRPKHGANITGDWGEGKGSIPNKANAHLMAAAPELLEAAEQIYNAVEYFGARQCPHGNGTGYPTHAWFCDYCFEALRDAIAEARAVTER